MIIAHTAAPTAHSAQIPNITNAPRPAAASHGEITVATVGAIRTIEKLNPKFLDPNMSDVSGPVKAVCPPAQNVANKLKMMNIIAMPSDRNAMIT